MANRGIVGRLLGETFETDPPIAEKLPFEPHPFPIKKVRGPNWYKEVLFFFVLMWGIFGMKCFLNGNGWIFSLHSYFKVN